ncbi:[LysW]-aminoadipate kinase [Actinomadura rupiterrae]|uniref:[LysW]-aminoadipate kinase n=1 Tax=Actinomadura rupiterrae TaxID=559627 RepID=UPI0020A4EA31|nr:[LysW]-aminoadipate kinase [Actinomadura rupiterrae]MCP2342424.1 acetylglutamate/LysW-gamma-L-alpha-aminoadipate kinase [Actinomadura rupiterrae]
MGVMVVKCGGAVPARPVCADLAGRAGEVVLVHGGAPEIERLSAELGVPARTLLSPSGVTSRHTDPAMLDVVTLALTGRAKPRLLRELAGSGVPAVGLTGLDGGLLQARRKAAQRAVLDDGRTVVVRDDHSGRITGVRPEVLRVLLGAGFVPVVSPPATGEDGAPVNVDADRAAAAVAAALGAERLVLLTSAPGVLRDASDPGSLLGRCALPREGPVPHAASGGMHRKLVAAREALLGGVPRVAVCDGRLPRPVTAALGGAGTTLEIA